MTFPGEALLIKLWETLAEKGVGGLLRPWQTKREGMAQLEIRRAEIIALAAAERDAEDIRVGRKRFADVAPRYLLPSPESNETTQQDPSKPIPEPPTPLDISTRVSLADAIRREVNVAKAVVYAEQQLRGDSQQPSERKVEEDWLFRWRDYAGEVSSDQLQILWGKLLAGELKSPGVYSLRTLEFLRNLSPSEAQDIARLSPFVVNDVLVRSQREILDEEGISFGFLLRMQDLGVVSGVESIGLNITYKSSEPGRFIRVFCSHGRVLMATHEDPAKTLKLETYNLTDIGRQILRLGTFAPHEKYLRRVGEEIKKQGFAVTLGNYREVSENQIQVFGEENL